MPEVPITMPQLGESIAEATLLQFLVKEGDYVQTDQEILEVETDKATMNVTAPCSGILKKWLAKPSQTYLVNSLLGLLEVSQEELQRSGLTPLPPTSAQSSDKPHFQTLEEEDRSLHIPSGSGQVSPTVRGLPVPANAQGATYMSPRLKARIYELGLHAADLAGVAGSGSGGRVTIEDFEEFVRQLESHTLSDASSMRVAVADAMRRSWTRPLATVGMPLRMDALLEHRKKQDPKPGPTLYALRALGQALGENNVPGGRLVGNKIVHPSQIDIGFAVEAEDGVLVPVLRNVDQQSLSQLLPKYQHLLRSAQNRKLPPDSTGKSIATVTNYGTFGLTWATPIPLPEQTLVLGLGAASKVPFWCEETQRFIPVHQSNLSLSFDHRVIDGGAAGRLLSRVAQLLQAPDTL